MVGRGAVGALAQPGAGQELVGDAQDGGHVGLGEGGVGHQVGEAVVQGHAQGQGGEEEGVARGQEDVLVAPVLLEAGVGQHGKGQRMRGQLDAVAQSVGAGLEGRDAQGALGHGQGGADGPDGMLGQRGAAEQAQPKGQAQEKFSFHVRKGLGCDAVAQGAKGRPAASAQRKSRPPGARLGGRMDGQGRHGAGNQPLASGL